MADLAHRVDLARHSQDESARVTPSYHPRPDSPLTERGVELAQAAARSLAADYAAVVHSPILRAAQTAALFAEVSGILLLAGIPCLSEWRPPGCVYGKTPDEYDDAYRAWRYARTQDPKLVYEDGESLLALHDRAAFAVHELERLADENGPLLVVSHKVFLGVIVNHDLGPVEAFQRATSEPWAHCEVRTLSTRTPKEA